ncbi:cadherin-related hmr-1-like [Mya arenaria]|uniref:cadherin-related hmr-1-like n=1 Tax=Mya arenaria TaxID=6604 RepID=UPI0022E63F40|nr:cadherin-related hmr-1-like [Mya arenaria]
MVVSRLLPEMGKQRTQLLGQRSLQPLQLLAVQPPMSLLMMQATRATDDGGGAVGTATITLPITDVNEAPTYANAQNEACAVDNSAADTVIGTYTATDQDSGDTITYSINSGNTNTDFTYGTDGKIKVATSKTLDMSTTATYTLVLHATDDDGTALTGSSTVTVSVQAACGAGAIGAMFASVLLAAIVSYLI